MAVRRTLYTWPTGLFGRGGEGERVEITGLTYIRDELIEEFELTAVLHNGIPVDWIGELIVNHVRPRAKDYNIIIYSSRVSPRPVVDVVVAMLDRAELFKLFAPAYCDPLACFAAESLAGTVP